MAINKKSAIAGIVVCVVLLAVCIVLNVVFATMANTLAMFFGGYSTSTINTDAEYDLATCYAEGFDVSTRALEEGAVMLKNENDTLPLAKGAKVTLLGAMTYNYVLGGTGSAGGKDDANTVTFQKAFSDAGLAVNPEAWQWMTNAEGGRRAQNTDPAYLAAGDPGMAAADWTNYASLNEFTRATYEQFVTPVIGEYKTAIVTIARSGAEGGAHVLDSENAGTTLNRTNLELSDDERALLSYAKENFDKTILLINSSNALECGFLDGDEYGVDACLVIGHPGESGIVGVANVIAGVVSPSGRLVDTYSYDHSTNPTYYNNDNNTYANEDIDFVAGQEGNGNANKFYQYEEGIYVGFRYYETADSVGYFDSADFKGIDTFKGHIGLGSYTNGGVSYDGGYDEIVQYPFGFGMSYTSFTQEIISSDIDLEPGGTNTVTVRITNTGEKAGKEVVQLYLDAPYRSDTENFGIRGVGLEKSKVSLVAFGKTDTLEPDASGEVALTFATDDLASFDNFGQGCYVLERGDYKFNVQANAHYWGADGSDNAPYDSVTASLSSSVIYKPAPESGRVDGATYVDKRASDANTAVNAMDDITAGDGNMLDGYLSRNSMAAGMAQIMTHESNETANETLPQDIVDAVNLKAGETGSYKYETYRNGVKAEFTKTVYAHGNDVAPYMTTTPDGVSVNDDRYKVEWGKTYFVEENDEGEVVMKDDGTFDVYENASDIASGKYHELSVDDMGLVPSTSELWDVLASMTTLDEAIDVQGCASYSTAAVPSVGKEYVSVLDGPAEVANGKYNGATWWPSATLLACTWNTELVYDIGVAYGHQSVLFNLGGTYAPAMNLHRSPYGGRNFEYFSEDGFISGEIGGSQVAGIQSTGTSVYIKHFAINDSDTNRQGVLTWANEQAIREIFALPFEISVKKYNADGIMGSMNRKGIAWSHYGFHTTMVYHDWGFNGFMITDGDGAFGDAYNSSSFFLLGAEGAILHVGLYVDDPQITAIFGDGATTTNYGQYKLQQTMKHALYQYSHSGQIEGVRAWWWVWIWVVSDVILLAAIVLVVIFKVLPALRGKGNNGN